MKPIWRIVPVIAVAMMLNGSIQSSKAPSSEELARLRQHGVTVRYLDDQTVELRQDWSGFRRVKTLREPDAQSIRRWIAGDSILLLEIDPRAVDTSQYSGWYTYWTSVPVADGFGVPPLAGDIDGNGKWEVYGSYKDFSTDFMTQIYEVDTSGGIQLRYTYVPRRGPAKEFTDIDRNGLQEVRMILGDSSFFYEQRSPNSLPLSRKLAYGEWEYPGTAIFTDEAVTELDNDTLIDFLYRGTLVDSTHPSGFQMYTQVAEYNPNSGNFEKVWKTQLRPPSYEGGIGGYDVGDYDGDGQTNFLASDFTGQVWVCEYTGTDNEYALVWEDSLALVNLLYQTSGDVDRDGKREFFVGATMGSGNWTIVYEADSNDHYSPTFAFHLLSGGSLDEPIYMTKDIDGDGKLELIVLSGGWLYVFKSNRDNFYYLSFLSAQFDGIGVNFFDFNNDGKLEVIVSRAYGDSLGGLKFGSDLFKSIRSTDDVKEPMTLLPSRPTLYQNYPNPFNAETNLQYFVPRRCRVTIKLFNVEGRYIGELFNGTVPPGRYERAWSGVSYSSGVYFYRLETSDGFVETIKMVLVR